MAGMLKHVNGEVSKKNGYTIERDVLLLILNYADGKGIFCAKDKLLNKREFKYILDAIPKKFESTPQRTLIRIFFNLIDENKDGFIEENEFARLYENRDEKSRKTHFQYANKSRTGKLTFDEFVKIFILKS
ncbi:hypothetical protein EIN_095440 [Entamoeba invadens IP1]|uniref:EF-hand domain-containing protein n=1 Tax=Entamoeba invadens IP1 TaxID=370355 RepID=A0A0A1U076_ENTIV|nr:hypothetical protein EIN_095440 [Entamoeba invadens IP1]ELP87287.1 hypothetical protein EIN_095440 [Entamoeba invadens IP1]|eukprot:XP_004254058.1 hypothetical protein EIN_095440 [Entamoeba invadens IP1]